jgi:hypothetical protein
VTVLQFSSGSWPERLKGFNRFGMTQEAVREESAAVVESAYLSFMTSSAEKNLDQARKAFEDRSASLALAVAHGSATRSRYACALDKLTAPSRYTWSDCLRVMAEIRSRVSPVVDASVNAGQERVFQPFLYAVRNAMLSRIESGQCTFVHNARLYSLRTRTAPSRDGMLLNGRVVEQGTNHESEFRVWFDPNDATGLPLRIEFRPKSYLHLVFEQDSTVGGPAIPSLMPKEQA